ncbi:hypothetical protein DPMN_093217 [Dreissena polymorpha]|uniref:Uncharacterized protein n=1 Tax=Dreissena polymorpha TaxID=45954 RepID=A0A9D4L3S2_DREPO|nr:hypothetical protein DPMN_093217 [Dreissena polymorpha]
MYHDCTFTYVEARTTTLLGEWIYSSTPRGHLPERTKKCANARNTGSGRTADLNASRLGAVTTAVWNRSGSCPSAAFNVQPM